MKLLLDFLPLLLFFGTFKYAERHAEASAQFATEHFGFLVSGGVVGVNEGPVLLATLVVIVATMAQVAWMLARGQKVHAMLWVSLALVTVLGAATVWFHNETFIKWKPSALYWAMGLAFWVSQAFLGKSLPQKLMGSEIDLPASVWRRLGFAWIAFFGLMGLANLYVAYSYSISTWASFKVFGLTGLLLVFALGQGLYVARHIKPEPEDSKAAGQASGRP